MKKTIIFSVCMTLVLGSLSLAKTTYVPKEKLMATMMEFSKALGVKCTFCHIADKSVGFDDVGKYDPAKDFETLENRAVAKGMLGNTIMTNKIQNKTGADEITCMACHKGVAKPVI